MKPWKAKKSLIRAPKFTTTLDPMEREVLGNLTSRVAEALMERARSAPKDELAEMMDMSTGNKEAPTDPSLARLLPDFEREGDEEYDGDNSLLRSLHETDIITGKLNNLQVVGAATGPDSTVEITLTEPEAHQFIAGLNDLRLYLAASEDDAFMPAEGRDNLVEWLAFNQDSLLTALIGD